MNRKTIVAMVGAFAVLGSLPICARAQKESAEKPHKKPGLIQRMFGRKKAGSPATHGVKSHTIGQIIGNKNTKVYHMPGDTGNMPAEKNRVYFRTAAEAEAAGYHRAATRGQGKAKGKESTARRDPKTGRFIKK